MQMRVVSRYVNVQMLGTYVPCSVDSLKNQDSSTDVNDKFYNSLIEPPKFLPVHRMFQTFMFVAFCGPVKLFLGALAFLLWMLVLGLLPFLRYFAKSDLQFKTAAHSIARHFIRLFLLCIGVVKIDVDGEVSRDTRILASNSVCILDFLVHFCCAPVTIVKKNAEPGFERMLIGSVFDAFKIKPKKRKACYQIANAASDPSFFPLLVFPEGITTNGDGILGFQPDAFNSDYTKQPVAIQYFMALTPRGFNSLRSNSPNGLTLSWNRSLVDLIFRLLAIPYITAKVGYLSPEELKSEPIGSHANPDATAAAKSDICQLKIANYLGSLAVLQCMPKEGKKRGN